MVASSPEKGEEVCLLTVLYTPLMDVISKHTLGGIPCRLGFFFRASENREGIIWVMVDKMELYRFGLGDSLTWFLVDLFCDRSP